MTKKLTVIRTAMNGHGKKLKKSLKHFKNFTNSKMKTNQKRINYHVLDYSTPWAEFLAYVEICHQLNVPGQPSVGRFMAYRRYLKEVGVI